MAMTPPACRRSQSHRYVGARPHVSAAPDRLPRQWFHYAACRGAVKNRATLVIGAYTTVGLATRTAAGVTPRGNKG